jgi:predicted dehydrogenase
MKEISIVLVGIGGFGTLYVKALIDNAEAKNYKLVAVVDTKPESSSSINRIKELNIPIYKSLEEFYLTSSADLVIVSSPIHFHKQQTCLALSKGSHVLCEKPLSATIKDSLKIIKAKIKSDRILAIGYQWSYSDAIQSLKRDIMNGTFGKAKTLKTIVLWPRDLKYFGRSWAGKKYDESGNAIFDSVANNATAHYLHNMFYVLGDKIDSSQHPIKVTAELYRANNIENFDTSAIRAVTETGAEVLFYASHAVKKNYGPVFSYEFEKAIVSLEAEGIIAKFEDGTSKNYGNPSEAFERKIWSVLDAIRGEKPVLCGPEAALSEVLCIEGAQNSKQDITTFPKELVKIYRNENNEEQIFVEGLDDALINCYENCALPSESGYICAKLGNNINLVKPS